MMIAAKVFVASFTFALVVAGSHSDAVTAVYDLAADWSDTSNPNPPWVYGTQSATGVFTPFPLHTNDYVNFGLPAFSGDQPAWANQVITGNNGSPKVWRRVSGSACSISRPGVSVGIRRWTAHLLFDGPPR